MTSGPVAPSSSGRAPIALSTQRVGVVLGAGGVMGWPYHLGVVSGLADHGLALVDAARVVGTSAGGAIAAAVLGAHGTGGASPEAILDEVLRRPSDAELEQYRSIMRERTRQIRRRLTPAAPRLLRQALPGGAGAGIAFAGVAPAGFFPTDSLRRFPGVPHDASWPPNLRLTAVSLESGAVRVFGGPHEDVPVIDAVEATQAVPLMFEPKHIDGNRHVDGATASSTHAELLLESHRQPPEGPPLDVAVIAAPMAGPQGGFGARLARRRLAEELPRLQRSGIHTVVIRTPPSLDDDVAALRRRDFRAGRPILEAMRHHTDHVLRTHGFAPAP